jgi:hypothetical protein
MSVNVPHGLMGKRNPAIATRLKSKLQASHGDGFQVPKRVSQIFLKVKMN